MSKIVQVKTPLELQKFLWKNGALLRAEDVNEEMVADTVEHWARLRMSRAHLLEEQDYPGVTVYPILRG
jgi:hypothetical protein